MAAEEVRSAGVLPGRGGAWPAWLPIVAAVALFFSGCAGRKREVQPIPPPPPPAPPAAASLPEAAATFDRVWSLINDHHFDTNFNGWNWGAARREFRPRALAASSNPELRGVLQEMVRRLGQSHLAILPGGWDIDGDDEDGGGGGANPGFEFRLLENPPSVCVTVVRPGSPAEESGVRPGWEIRRVHGRPVAALLETLPKGVSSPQAGFLAWRMMERKLGGAGGSRVEVEFVDERGNVHLLDLLRAEPPGARVQFSHLPPLRADLTHTNLATAKGRQVGLIRFNIWMVPTALAFDRALDAHRGADGVVIDLRGNIGGLAGMPMGVAGHFFTEAKLLGTLVTRDSRMEFRANPRLVNPDNKRVEPYAGALAILVDEISVSASEMFAGTMRETGRARIFGRRTTGQAIPAVMESLPNGDIFYRPIADFVTAGGNRLEVNGVVPDEELPRVRADLSAGRDRALEAALEWLDAQLGAPRNSE